MSTGSSDSLAAESLWHVYLLECADGSLYTGIARDPVQRLTQHNAGQGAKYTRARRPVSLVWSETAPNRSQALQREYAIKQLKRQDKLKLIRPRTSGGF